MRSTEKMVLRALVLSLLAHCLAFGTWKWGQTQGWWQAQAVPRWLQAVTKMLAPIPARKIVLPPPQQAPLLFVNVDPALAIQEPKNPKYFGAHSTVAANPQITRPSTVPDIRGQQDKVLRTTTIPKSAAKPATPTPPAQQQKPPAQAPPKKAYLPGDLAMAQPSAKPQQKEGTADSPSDQAPTQPVHQRPRTLEEAMARQGLSGEKTHQAGGVNRISNDSALDVKGTISGTYFENFVAAVQTHWDQLLRQDPVNAGGKVVLHFKLHANGGITDMKMISNEVTDLLGTICEQAVLDPAPYEKWPQQMRLENPGDSLELTFTFYYETY